MTDKLTPVASIEDMEAYSVPRPPIPVDLYLHGNEGPSPDEELLEHLKAAGTDTLRQYPSKAELEALIADSAGVDSSRVFVSAGADESIDRICRALLTPEHSVVLPEPTFVMFRHYAGLADARVRSVSWESGAYPTDEVLEAIDDTTRVVAMVTPNNPTGAYATEDDLRRVAEAAPHALIVLDHAYVEFTEHDLTQVALEYDNVAVMRTLSKAYGMAGIRVGYTISSPQVVTWLERAGGPYSVSGPSLQLAASRLREEGDRLENFVEEVRRERRLLEDHLQYYGVETTVSEGNFVFARVEDSEWVRDAMAGMGILIRAFPGHELLGDAIRISCPGNPEDFERLLHAIDTIFEPEALLFDLDGVLADVSRSYRLSIVETAKSFGVEVTFEDIAEMKASGDANNDWRVTQRLLAERGVEVEFDEVHRRFEEIYQGTEEEPGLWKDETLLVDFDELMALAERYRIGIVTGRPRKDAERFIREHKLEWAVEGLVCMEDADLKPDPAPVELLKVELIAQTGWLIGDTPDDVQAARGAGILPIGVVAPGDDKSRAEEALTQTGAARVFDSLIDELKEVLP